VITVHDLDPPLPRETGSQGQIGTPSIIAGAGVPMPAGATFQYDGSDMVAPSGDEGYGGAWSSYFFAGPQGDVPQPMTEGWGGCYGTYGGVAGWIVTEIA